MIKLSELRPDKCSCSHEPGDSDCAKHPVCWNCGASLDGTCVVAACAAMPVLIELARATLAREAASLAAARSRSAYFRAKTEESWSQLERDKAEYWRCDREYAAALKQVTP